VGPAPRRHGPDASARGSRRRARPDPRALRRRAGLRTRDARAGSRLGGLGQRAPRRPAAGHPRNRSADSPRRGLARGALARSGSGAPRATGQRNRHQQRVDRAPRRGERTHLPAYGRRRGRRRPGAARTRSPHGGRAQGRPPRERDGNDAAAPRRPPPTSRRGQRGCRQQLRAPGAVHARATPGDRRPRLPDRRGRLCGDRTARRWAPGGGVGGTSRGHASGCRPGICGPGPGRGREPRVRDPHPRRVARSIQVDDRPARPAGSRRLGRPAAPSRTEHAGRDGLGGSHRIRSRG
jgi:hypothetical protein